MQSNCRNQESYSPLLPFFYSLLAICIEWMFNLGLTLKHKIARKTWILRAI